jgi:hypothetical protein
MTGSSSGARPEHAGMHNAHARPHPCIRPAPARLRACAATVLAFALLAGLGSAWGNTASATFEVRAVVKRFLRMQLISQPRWMELSERDIASGHFDVPLPLQLAVESNSPDAYAIVFACSCEHVQGGLVRGLGQERQIGNDGTPLQWRPAGRREVLEFSFRFALPPDARPGRYPWPIQVTVSPV